MTTVDVGVALVPGHGRCDRWPRRVQM